MATRATFRSGIRSTVTALLTLSSFAPSKAAVMFGSRVIADGRASAGVKPPLPIPVLTIPVQPQPGYAVIRRFVGQIEAAQEVSLGFGLSGRITRVLVDEGAKVPEGAVLVRLDTTALIPERATLEAGLAALAEDPRAAPGERAAIVEVVAGSARHIASTTVTTFGGFLQLILGGIGYWPPFPKPVVGGVLLSVTLAFAFTPQMFEHPAKLQNQVAGQLLDDPLPTVILLHLVSK